MCKTLKLTNICFADDLMIFCKANTRSVHTIWETFSEFSITSGLYANQQKSNIYIRGVSDQVKQEILELTGCNEGVFPMRYLGVPLSPTKWNKMDCKSLVDKVSKLLSRWASRNLSYAGRCQLINSVLFSVYWATIFILPQSVLKELEQKCRRFLWGGDDSHRKTPLIAWDMVCLDKKSGGLNIKDCRNWNIAAIGKLVWAVSNKKDTLWVKWVNAVYLKGAEFWSYNPSQDCSWAWKRINKVKEKLRGGYLNQKWIGNSKGEYTIQGGYSWLQGRHALRRDTQYVWNPMNIPKHAFINWLVMHQRIQTKDRLSRFVELDNLNCVLCDQMLESCGHLFFECVWAQQVLAGIMQWLGVGTWPTDSKRWRRWTLFAFRKWRVKQKVIMACVASVVYKIWIERNQRVYAQTQRHWKKLVDNIKDESKIRIQPILSNLKRDRDKRYIESILNS